MLVVVEDFTRRESVTTDASPIVAAMPGSRLRELQVSRRARITTISDTPYFEADFASSSLGLGYDVVAVIGYDGAPSRNMLRSAHRPGLDDPPWTRVGMTIGGSVVAPPSGFPFRVRHVAMAAGANRFEQDIATKPGKGGSGSFAMPLSSTLIIKQGANDADLRIVVFSGAGTDFANATFDLSAGTVGSPSTGGSFSGATAAIVALGGGWYLCRLNYTTDTADDLTVRYLAVTPGGSSTLVGNEEWEIGGPTTMLQTADQANAEYPLTNHTGNGPMFQVRVGPAGGGWVDSGWFHMASRNAFREFPRYGFWHQYADLRPEDQVRVELWDPTNANTYIEAGRLIVGRAASLGGGLECPTVALLAEESGGQIEADGGQIYRPQRTIRRGLSIRLRYNIRAAAFDEYYFLLRTAGRSRQVLVIAEEDETEYMQDGMVYGYINALRPVPISGSNGRYELRLDVIEAP